MKLIAYMSKSGNIMHIKDYERWLDSDGGNACENFKDYTIPLYVFSTEDSLDLTPRTPEEQIKAKSYVEQLKHLGGNNGNNE